MEAINDVSSVLPKCIHMLMYIIPRVTKNFHPIPHIKQQRNMVNLTGGNRSGLTGYRSNRSGPVPVSTGTQPAKIQILNLNLKNKKFPKNS